MPQRVLKIHQPIFDGPEISGSVTLCEPGDDIRTNYVALSHCWGRHPMPLRTEFKTFQSLMRDGIQISHPQPVFRDAVQVCYRLGVIYAPEVDM